MERITIEGIDVHRCTSCAGLWFDALEDTKLLASAETIDVGDSRAGANSNAIDHVNCPVCPNTPMIRMVDNRQPHIRFESCASG